MWPFPKRPASLADHLRGGSQIKINGILFTIRKLNPMDYLEGAKVMHEIYATYKSAEDRKIDAKMIKSANKARDYMRDVIMAGVVSPKLVRKQTEDTAAVCVDEIFNDWTMANQLTAAIISLTYGKKK